MRRQTFFLGRVGQLGGVSIVNYRKVLSCQMMYVFMQHHPLCMHGRGVGSTYYAVGHQGSLHKSCQDIGRMVLVVGDAR